MMSSWVYGTVKIFGYFNLWLFQPSRAKVYDIIASIGIARVHTK